MYRVLGLTIALAACAPVPRPGAGDGLTATGMRPGLGSAREFAPPPTQRSAGSGKPVAEALYSLDEQGMLIDMDRLHDEQDLGGYQEIRRVE